MPSPHDPSAGAAPRNGDATYPKERHSRSVTPFAAWQEAYALLKDKERDLTRAKSHAKGAKILAETKGAEGAAPSQLFAKAAMFAEEAEDPMLAADYRMAQADHLQTEGDETGNTETIKEAIILYHRLLAQNLPGEQHAAASHQLGNALYKLYKLKGDPEDLRQCVETLTKAGDLYASSSADTETLAAVMSGKGQALRAQAERRESSLLFIAAARCFEKRASLLEICKAPPKDQAEALNLAGVCYTKASGEEQRAESLGKAVKKFEEALRRFGTGGGQVKGKSAVQNNLGYALLKMSERVSDSSLLRKAAGAFEAALEQEHGDVSPLTAAATRYNLGATLLQIGETEKGINRLLEAEAELKAIPAKHYAGQPAIKARIARMTDMIAQTLHDAHGKNG